MKKEFDMLKDLSQGWFDEKVILLGSIRSLTAEVKELKKAN